MKRLELINNIERARIMHMLFPDEMLDLIGCIDEISKEVIQTADEIRSTWSNKAITADFWIRLATKIQRRIVLYGDKLVRQNNRFSEELFDNYLAIFSAHCIHAYAGKSDNVHFKAIATLFFGYNPNEG